MSTCRNPTVPSGGRPLSSRPVDFLSVAGLPADSRPAERRPLVPPPVAAPTRPVCHPPTTAPGWEPGSLFRRVERHSEGVPVREIQERAGHRWIPALAGMTSTAAVPARELRRGRAGFMGLIALKQRYQRHTAATVHLMATIQIKNIPENVHRRLRIRAASAGQSLQQYMLEAVCSHAELASVEELLERKRTDELALGPSRVDASTIVELIRQDRESR